MFSEKLKAIKSQNSLEKKQYISKQSLKIMNLKIAKSSSPSVRWKANSSLTQKGTMG